MHAQESTETMTCTMLPKQRNVNDKRIEKKTAHVPCNSFPLSIMPYELIHQVDDQKYLQEKWQYR